MTALDNQTSQRLMQLVDQIKGDGVQEIYRKDWRPLRIAKVRPLILPDGQAFLFAAGLVDQPDKHEFRPMMHFIIQDNRTNEKASRKLVIYPALYRDDPAKIAQNSATINGPFIVGEDKYLQTIHAQIARDWLQHLYSKGYLS